MSKIARTVLLISLSLFMFSTHAEDEKTIEQEMAALKMEKAQAEAMVRKMIISGRLGQEEATHVRREIASVKEEDVKVIRAKALDKLNSAGSLTSLATK